MLPMRFQLAGGLIVSAVPPSAAKWAIITSLSAIEAGAVPVTEVALAVATDVALTNPGKAAVASLVCEKKDAAAKNSATAYNATHAFIGTRGNVTILLTTTGLLPPSGTTPKRSCDSQSRCRSR